VRLIALATALFSALAPPAAAQGRSLNYAGLRAEAAQFLSEYIRINTTHPPGNELATARWLKNVLAREGMQ
jgi:hypothetical protein